MTKWKTKILDWNSETGMPYEKIPVYSTSYDCLKECLFRFRNVPTIYKFMSKDVCQKLLRVIVCIAHAKLGLNRQAVLQEATDLALEIQISVRALEAVNAISLNDYEIISHQTDSLVRQMLGWAKSENLWTNN